METLKKSLKGLFFIIPEFQIKYLKYADPCGQRVETESLIPLFPLCLIVHYDGHSDLCGIIEGGHFAGRHVDASVTAVIYPYAAAE